MLFGWMPLYYGPFYKTLLTLRKTNPAFAADAIYKRLQSSNDDAIFSYLREKNGHKVVVTLNLSIKEQKFTIKDKSIAGMPMNVFLMQKEAVNASRTYPVEPWAYIVYDYK